MINLSDINKVFGPLQRVAEGGKLVPVNYEEMKKFDLDLKFGQLGEDFVRDMQGGNTKIEVKTERDIWKNTGNIAIEIRCNGLESVKVEAMGVLIPVGQSNHYQALVSVPAGTLAGQYSCVIQISKTEKTFFMQIK